MEFQAVKAINGKSCKGMGYFKLKPCDTDESVKANLRRRTHQIFNTHIIGPGRRTVIVPFKGKTLPKYVNC